MNNKQFITHTTVVAITSETFTNSPSSRTPSRKIWSQQSSHSRDASTARYKPATRPPCVSPLFIRKSVTDSPRNSPSSPHHQQLQLPDIKQPSQPSQAAESRCLAKRKTVKTTSRMDTDRQELSNRPYNYQ